MARRFCYTQVEGFGATAEISMIRYPRGEICGGAGTPGPLVGSSQAAPRLASSCRAGSRRRSRIRRVGRRDSRVEELHRRSGRLSRVAIHNCPAQVDRLQAPADAQTRLLHKPGSRVSGERCWCFSRSEQCNGACDCNYRKGAVTRALRCRIAENRCWLVCKRGRRATWQNSGVGTCHATSRTQQTCPLVGTGRLWSRRELQHEQRVFNRARLITSPNSHSLVDRLEKRISLVDVERFVELVEIRSNCIAPEIGW